jgi:hypothetical protein
MYRKRRTAQRVMMWKARKWMLEIAFIMAVGEYYRWMYVPQTGCS